MENKNLTKQEKISRAQALRDFFKEVNTDDYAGHKMIWENVYQRALWILTD